MDTTIKLSNKTSPLIDLMKRLNQLENDAFIMADNEKEEEGITEVFGKAESLLMDLCNASIQKTLVESHYKAM